MEEDQFDGTSAYDLVRDLTVADRPTLLRRHRNDATGVEGENPMNTSDVSST